MSTIVRLRGAMPLLLLLALTGCKEGANKEGAANQDAAKPGEGKQTQAPKPPTPQEQIQPNDMRKGIGKYLPSVNRAFLATDLQSIAKLYEAELLAGNSPKSVKDLSGLEPRVVREINDGLYVVLWNAKPNTPGTAVVAYEKDADTKGGMVANLTGSVTKMSVQEFKAAPKASGN
jgi:hypothetical protein